MNAVVNNQPCQCELCQPNWYMGRADDSFEPQPAPELEPATTPTEPQKRLLTAMELVSG